MVEKMEHTLVNPNWLHLYGITVQNNPFVYAPIFISMQDHVFSLKLVRKVTVIVVSNIPQLTNIFTLSHISLYCQNMNGIHKTFTS